MTLDEMIAVIQAHKEGKQVQYKACCQGSWAWKDCSENKPSWDFVHFDFRIKPEPHYRPFKNAEEVMEAIKEHGDWVRVKGADRHIMIAEFDGNCVRFSINGIEHSIDYMFLNYTFADGTPFGVKED